MYERFIVNYLVGSCEESFVEMDISVSVYTIVNQRLKVFTKFCKVLNQCIFLHRFWKSI